MAGQDETATPGNNDTPKLPRRPRRHQAPSPLDSLLGTERPGGSHERVHRSLMHAIASGIFAAGGRLPSEPQLASAFAVSRPVVRQALERLRADGVIQSLRGSGNYVADVEGLGRGVATGAAAQAVTRRMLQDLEFRLVVEPEAAALAAHRHRPEDLDAMTAALLRFEEAQAANGITHHVDYLFHRAIAVAAGNPRFAQTLEALEYQADDERLLMRHLVHFRPAARGTATLREHRQVLDLIRQRDAEAARRSMSTHIDQARRRLAVRLRPLPFDGPVVS